MNKLVAATAVILALLGAASLPAQGAGVSTQKLAFGSWTVPTDKPNRFLWYFAAGSNDLHVGEEELTFGTVGKGSCIRERGRDFVSISCSGRSGVWEDDPSAFKMDAAATDARVRVKKNGITHSARIVSGDPNDDGIYTAELVCETGGGFGTGIFRIGDATGHMFGRKLTTQRWFDFSMLMSGAFVEACEGADDLFADLAAGKEIELTFVKN